MSARHVLTINAGSATLKIGIYETGATGATGGDPRQLWRVGGPLSLIYTVVVVCTVNLLFWIAGKGWW